MTQVVKTVYDECPAEAQAFIQKMGVIWGNKIRHGELAQQAKLILPTVREKRQKLSTAKSEITRALYEAGVAPNVEEAVSLQKEIESLTLRIQVAEEKAGVDPKTRNTYIKIANFHEKDAMKMYPVITGAAIPTVSDADPTVLAKLEEEQKAKRAVKRAEKKAQK